MKPQTKTTDKADRTDLQKTAAAWFRDLRDQICQGFEDLEDALRGAESRPARRAVRAQALEPRITGPAQSFRQRSEGRRRNLPHARTGV